MKFSVKNRTGLIRPRSAYAALAMLSAFSGAGCDRVTPGADVQPTTSSYKGALLTIDVPPVNGTPAVRFMCKDAKCDDKVAVSGDTEGDRWNKIGTGAGNAAQPVATLGASAILGPAAGTSIAIDNAASAIGQQRINKTNATNNGQGNTIELNYNLTPMIRNDGTVVRFNLGSKNLG